MMRPLLAIAGFALMMALSQSALACGDHVPRTAIVSAFEPEWTALNGVTHERRECRIGGVGFVTGTLGQHRVVLFLSGVSMVNASMTTQSALDHFHIKRLIFTGIAGATDTTLAIGDVAGPPWLAHKASHEGVHCVEQIIRECNVPAERSYESCWSGMNKEIMRQRSQKKYVSI